MSTAAVSSKQEAVDQLIEAYRRYGHFQATLDPLGLKNYYQSDQRLTLAYHGLTTVDGSTCFDPRGVLPQTSAKLSDILATLSSLYCGNCGYEYRYIDNEEESEWLRDYIESRLPNRQLDRTEKLALLQNLLAAEGLEKYLDVKYPGQKRFSIEGLETLIPLLNDTVLLAKQDGIQELRWRWRIVGVLMF